MRRTLYLATVFLAVLATGCDERIGDYVSASSISENGFLRTTKASVHSGQFIKLWGYVDYANLFGDAGAKEILGDWWGGDGPDPTTWRFNLKAHPDDKPGNSFAVLVPNDKERGTVLQVFADNARARQPTRVFVAGKIVTFDAPVNITRRLGLYIELAGSSDIAFSTRR